MLIFEIVMNSLYQEISHGKLFGMECVRNAVYSPLGAN